MKIDKSNPLHWLYLFIFFFNVCLVIVFRSLLRNGCRDKAILYGHKLNGNLKAIMDHAQGIDGDIRLYFLTMDPAYYRALKQSGQRVLLALNPLHMYELVSTFAVISSHGLHVMALLTRLSDLKFVDVWHGIPYKGFDADDFRLQHHYDEIWLTSGRLKTLYVKEFGFRESILHVTGYARTDVLVNNEIDRSAVRRTLNLPDHGKRIILFAPTWQQDDKNRKMYPFGASEREFLETMDSFCRTKDVICVLRAHLNTQMETQWQGANIFFRPYEDYPNAEEVLLITDILVCDWSSIAFDYLLLDRPTIFLDVEAPFRKGFSLDETYRYGKVVGGVEEMFAALEIYLHEPGDYLSEFSIAHQRIKQEVYGDMADGHAAERCYKRLLGLSA